MRWVVYRVDKRHPIRHIRKLGCVNAPYQPAAIQRAWARWPKEIDPAQRQGGITVRTLASEKRLEARARTIRFD